MDINIGDKVRFLREVGGGRVTGFRKGGLVMVEDKDGFEIPMPENDLVVIPDNTRFSTTAEESPIPQHMSSPTADKSMEERILHLERMVQLLHRRLLELENSIQ